MLLVRVVFGGKIMEDNKKLFNSIYNMKKKEIEKKYKFLGEGISRRVYAVDKNYVVKIAKGKEGIYQNQVEYYVYTHVDEEYKKYLCPIVWFDPKMLFMKRADPLSKYIKDDFLKITKVRSEDSAVKDLKYLSAKFFLYYKDIISTSSWGKVDGGNILIDYGCTNEIGDIYYNFLFRYLTKIKPNLKY